MRRGAIAVLSALPRALFNVHNFYNVDLEPMTGVLTTDSDTIAACLAEARAMIHGYRLYARSARFDPARAGAPTAQFERALGGPIRTALPRTSRSAVMTIRSIGPWRTPTSRPITMSPLRLVTFLDQSLRNAVPRARRSHVAIVEL